jgi:hypothetical protein
MTHEEIEALNLDERYLMGRLAPDECARFEEHFVDCPECLDRLEAAERFRAALKPIAAAEAARASAVRPAKNRWRLVLLAAATLVAAVVPVIFLAMRGVAARRELDVARAAAAGWQHRFEQEQSANRALRNQSVKPPPLPMIGAVFYLNTSRAAGTGTEPVDRITLPPDWQWVVLSIEREFPREFQSIRATLADAVGKVVWQQTGIRPVSERTLGLLLPSDLLHEGEYTLELEGLSGADRYFPAGRYRLVVAMEHQKTPPLRSK